MFGRKKKKKTEKELGDIGRTIEIPISSQEPVSVSFNGLEVQLKFGNAQHIGRRKTQEDSFGFSSLMEEDISARGLFAVLADGMGGLRNGRQISQFVVTEALSYFSSLDYSLPVCSQLEAFVKGINVQVYDVYGSRGKAGAGSTFVAALLRGNSLYWCTTGDSRLYLYRNERLYQLNEDHDYKNRLLDNYIHGSGNLQTAFSDPQKDALSSYIGCPPPADTDTNRRPFKLLNGDRILLATDGIYNALPDDAMARRMKEEPQAACDRLIQDVLDRNISGQDNMTVMAVSYNQNGGN